MTGLVGVESLPPDEPERPNALLTALGEVVRVLALVLVPLEEIPGSWYQLFTVRSSRSYDELSNQFQSAIEVISDAASRSPQALALDRLGRELAVFETGIVQLGPFVMLREDDSLWTGVLSQGELANLHLVETVRNQPSMRLIAERIGDTMLARQRREWAEAQASERRARIKRWRVPERFRPEAGDLFSPPSRPRDDWRTEFPRDETYGDRDL
jgi:hypothetical protein